MENNSINSPQVLPVEPRVLARYFEEDLVYRLDNRGRGQIGLVVTSCENESDTEDDESVDGYSSLERVSKGRAKIVWYPSGTHEVVEEDSVKLFDRSLLPGDVVRNLNQQGGQLGFISDSKVKLSLKILGTNKMITDVDADDFITIFPVQDNEVIVYKDWLGYVNETDYIVLVQAPNGLTFALTDFQYRALDKLVDERRDELHFESLPHIGELLLAEPRQLSDCKVYKGSTDSQNSVTEFSLPFIKMGSKRKVLLQVKDVRLSRIDVRWMFCKPSTPPSSDASEVFSKPDDIINEDSVNCISPVNYFKNNSFQTSDRGYYIVKESDNIISYDDWIYDFEGDETSEPMATTPTPVATGRTTHQLSHRRKKHRLSLPITKTPRKKLKACKAKIQPPVDLTSGNKVAVEIIATQMTASVTWQDGTIQQDISSTDLYPIHHVNDHEFFPGDFVVENKDDFEFSVYGVIQEVCRAERTAIVNWFRILLPEEVSVSEKTETVSVYDIKDHPDFQYRPGSIVMRIDNKKSTNDTPQTIESCVGQLINFLPTGKLHCKWMNNTYEAVDPQGIIHITDNDSDDFFSQDEYSDDEIDEFLSSSLEAYDKETDRNLSEVFNAVNSLERWLTQNSTFNNRNGMKVSRMLCNLVKAIGEFDQHSKTNLLQLDELKNLIDLSKPPTVDNLPGETPIMRLISRIRKELEMDSKEKESPVVNSAEESVSYDSPVSRRTKESLNVLKKIKQQLFPLCNAGSTESTVDSTTEETTQSTMNNTSENSEVTEETCDEETPPQSQVATCSVKVSFVDSVPDCHKFKLSKFDPVKPAEFISTWRKEIKLLNASLPEGIIVKAFHDRMDLISFMIVGPKNTPYEDGLFLFDVQLPAKYPHVPPLVHYIAFCNDRLNPNLYENGKVCVSLLGTWNGKGYEVWCPSASTLLQVIISIQGLILVPEPYFNEAGYLKQRETDVGNENSRLYNEMAVVKVTQSMARMFANPPETFKEEVIAHAKERGNDFLNRLKSWTLIDAPASLADFPLLPPSKGLRLSLLRAISELDKVLQALSTSN